MDVKVLNSKSKDMITEKDAKNESGTIFIESVTKKWGRMGLLEKNDGLKISCYLLRTQRLHWYSEKQNTKWELKHSGRQRKGVLMLYCRSTGWRTDCIPKLCVCVQWLIPASSSHSGLALSIIEVYAELSCLKTDWELTAISINTNLKKRPL